MFGQPELWSGDGDREHDISDPCRDQIVVMN